MQLRIAYLRKLKGIQQGALAEHLGISRAYLSQIETGKRPLKALMQKQIADFIGVNPQDLVNFDGAEPSDIDKVMMAMSEGTDGERRMIVSLAQTVLAGKRGKE